MECGTTFESIASSKPSKYRRSMNRSLALFRRTAAFACGLTALSPFAMGADTSTNTPPVRVDLDDEADHTGWFVRLGVRATSGLKVSLQDRQAAPSIVPGQYDNGYVHPDISGSTSTTWNWGDSSASQVKNGSVILTRLDGTPRAGTFDYPSKTLYGGEMVVGVEMARFDFRKREAKFGFEAGYSYSQIKTQSQSITTGTVTYISDAYSLGGLTPPTAPYSGSYATPGQLISLNPVSAAPLTSAASATLSSQVRGEFHNIRIGPWIDLPWSSRFSTAFSAGYATIYGHGVLDLAESVSIANPAIPPISLPSGRYTRNQFIPGAYLQIRLEYRLTHLIGVYVGGEFQYNTGMTVTAPTRAARFDLGSTYGGVAGVSLNF